MGKKIRVGGENRQGLEEGKCTQPIINPFELWDCAEPSHYLSMKHE